MNEIKTAQTAVEEKDYTTLNLGTNTSGNTWYFPEYVKMDGEIIVDAVPTIGYIHRAFEKIAERRPFYQITAYRSDELLLVTHQ
jgi:NADH-quinone oxidoreductase subunit D